MSQDIKKQSKIEENTAESKAVPEEARAASRKKSAREQTTGEGKQFFEEGEGAANIKTPWYAFYGDIPAHLNYPDRSMIDLIEKNAQPHLDLVAYEFQNVEVTYREFFKQVRTCAKAIRALGIAPGDRVTICMPNTPQGVVMFYALNMVGAIPNMVHPLSSEGEIEFFLNVSHSKAILVLDGFYGKVKAVRKKCPDLKKVIVTGIGDALKGAMKVGYKMTVGRKIPKVKKDEPVVFWKDFLAGAQRWTSPYEVHLTGTDAGAILYSGGTTGTTKGILLSNLNFNALAMQTLAFAGVKEPAGKMLSIMPIFHGFGLGVGVHTMLVGSCTCHLVPQFSVDTYADLLRKVQPQFIAGVPTLYEALLRSDKMKGVDLACLKGMFSGGDSLSIELKKKVDLFLKEHNASVQVREGYGLTECVTASCLTPEDDYREGSIGIPFPDTYYKVVKPSTKIEVSYGTEGEICISGPTVMMEYLDNAEETEDALQIHEDGLTWLHTGDLGVMDEDGFIYYKQRLKRMIVSSGYSIYPSQLENVIDANENVLMSTVIGVPDPYKVQKVKAYIVLKHGVKPTAKVKEEIEQHCRKNIAKYALPYEYEYRDELPKTLVGKVAYTVLEAEAIDALKSKPEKKGTHKSNAMAAEGAAKREPEGKEKRATSYEAAGKEAVSGQKKPIDEIPEEALLPADEDTAISPTEAKKIRHTMQRRHREEKRAMEKRLRRMLAAGAEAVRRRRKAAREEKRHMRQILRRKKK